MFADAIFKTLILVLTLWIIVRTMWAWSRIQLGTKSVHLILVALTIPAVLRLTYTLWRFSVTGFLSSLHFTAWVNRFIDLISILSVVVVQAILIHVKVHYFRGMDQ